MMSYSKLSKNPKQFERFTGLSPEKFNRLFQKIEKEYPQYEVERLSKRPRINAVGQGSKFKLSLRDRVIMFLCYYKMYITEELCGFLFDINQSNVNRNIKRLEPLMERCLPTPKKNEEKDQKNRESGGTREDVPRFESFC